MNQNMKHLVAPKQHNRLLIRRLKLYQCVEWIVHHTRRGVVALFIQLFSKEWLSQHHWMIRISVILILVTIGTMGGWLVFHIGITQLIWLYQHFQCYTRESSIQWVEGPPHTMRRPCPSMTQYRTVLEEQQMRMTGAMNRTAADVGGWDPSKICITTLSDSSETVKKESLPFLQRHQQQQQQPPLLHTRKSNAFRCRNFDHVSTITWPNHLAYAQKHGYLAVDQSYLLDPTRPPAWSKIRAVQELFTSQQYHCEWVLWLDADTVFMNSSISLESILPYHNNYNSNNIGGGGDTNSIREMDVDTAAIDLIVTSDRRFTANSGVWLIRNSLWSRQFLQEWWDLKSYVRPSGLSLSGDNDAFGYLIRRYNTTTTGTSTTTPTSSSPIRMIPRCRMNSFGVFVPSTTTTTSTKFTHNAVDHSNQKKEEDEEWYVHADQYYYAGDFIAHASGIDQKEVGVQLLLSRAL
jgi:galactosyl transferase GMA12/MNN10 family